MIDLIGYGAFFLTTGLSFALICLGLNLQWGQTGLFNVGIAGFVAVGAYASAILTTPETADRLGGFDLPIVIGWAGGMLAAGMVAAVVGFATLRLRSDYLAITTFGVAVAVHLVALNAQWLTGGAFGIGFIPRPFGAMASRPFAFNMANLAVVALVTLVVFLALQSLARSPWGRVLRALREDETAAVSLGKSARFYRVQAFAVGGAVMGLAGAVQAHFIGFIAPDNYLPMGSLIVWAIWAGSGAVTSSVFPPEQQARAAALQVVAIGVMLCLILLLRPRGLLGEERRISRHIGGGK